MLACSQIIKDDTNEGKRIKKTMVLPTRQRSSTYDYDNHNTDPPAGRRDAPISCWITSSNFFVAMVT